MKYLLCLFLFVLTLDFSAPTADAADRGGVVRVVRPRPVTVIRTGLFGTTTIIRR